MKLFSKKVVSFILVFVMVSSVFGDNLSVSANTSTSEASEQTTEAEIVSTEEKLTELLSAQGDFSGKKQENGKYYYETEGYKVSLKVDNSWGEGFNATITIANTGEKTIEDWYLSFELSNKISNIWNASIVKDDDGFYVIKNASWNQDIAVGSSVSFGFTAQGQFKSAPEYYGFPGRSIELDEEDYSVEYVITEDWIEGFTGKIIIKNNSDKVLEDWYLEFDFDNKITNIWNAVIEEYSEKHYLVNNDKSNSDIAVGGSVEFGFQVKKGNAANLIENVIVRQRGFDEKTLDSVLLLTGKYNEEDNAIDMLWSGTRQQGEYSIYIAGKEQKYNLIDTIHDTEYSYALKEIDYGFKCYIVQSLEEKTLKSNVLTVLYKDGKFIVDIPDTDKDGLYDYLEKAIGTDSKNADTDGDGLNDYYEYMVLNTDPLKKDTDGNGISDADEDFDADNLNNKQEMENDTDPLIADSDCDGLIDGDEVNKNLTEPKKADTDEDGLPDGDEIRFATDPFVEDTNGNGILDGDEIYTVVLSSDEIENDGVIIPSLEMELEGYQMQTLFVNMIENDDPYINDEIPGYIGCGYDFNVSDKIRDNLSADITYKFDESLWEQDDFSPAVFYFNEETNKLEKVESQSINGNSVEFSVTHFSIYILLNEGAFDSAWDGVLTGTVGPTYLGLLLDGSGSMSNNDRQRIRYTCSDTLIEKLNENDQVAVMGFDYSSRVYQSFTEDKSAAKLAVRKTYTSGGTDIPYALRCGIELYRNIENGNKLMVLLTDGDSSYVGLDSILSDAVSKNIIIFTIGLGNGVNASKLKNIAEATGGKYFFAKTADDLNDAYDDLLKTIDDERYTNSENPLDVYKWYPRTTIANVVDECGFNYYDKDDIIYSILHPHQEKLGYCYAYDEGAVAISANIDCEPIYFFYNGKEYMVELWKGQYGLESGGEVGVYCRETGEKRGVESVLGKWYAAVGKEDYVSMKFSLYNNEKMFDRVNQKHWWLTGFKWGELTTDPSSLKMDINMVFPNAGMAEAFVKGYSEDMKDIYEQSSKQSLSKNSMISFNNDDDGKYGLVNMGYEEGSEYTINGNEVHVIFDDTKAKQPLTRTVDRQMTFINGINDDLVNKYQLVKTICGVQNNDPNNFNKTAAYKLSKKAVYDCLIDMDADGTLTDFIAKSDLSVSQKIVLIALINSKIFDSFTDDLYEEISKCLAEEFSEAYVGMEKDARRLVNRVFEGATELVEALPK